MFYAYGKITIEIRRGQTPQSRKENKMNDPKSREIQKFNELVNLIQFLDNEENKQGKVKAIKLARKNNLINEDEAIELAVEFC